MFLSASNEDTIAAVATPAGQAGIGIVRMSGPQAVKSPTGFSDPKTRRTPFRATGSTWGT